MKKRFTTTTALVACLFAFFEAASQCDGLPCTEPVVAFDAAAACILSSEHDLSCYQGATIASTPVSLPPFWCTSIENNQWFAFTASSENVSFEIAVTGCVSGGALQAALLQTQNCFDFDFVSDCLGNIEAFSYTVLSNNVPLIPGEVYYLMIDGSAGAECGYTINGGTVITNGAAQVCLPSPPITYYSNNFSNWTITPPTAGTVLTSMPSSQVQVQWNQLGNATLCASSSDCSSNTPFCIDILVGETAMDTVTHYLCAGETVLCGGGTIETPGFYENYVPTPSGCDSIVYCNIIGIPPINYALGAVPMPCEGLYMSCGDTITELGFYETICQSWQGCDSTVSFLLVPGDVLASAGPDISVPCNGTQTTLDGSASSQGSNFSYQWSTANGNIISGASDLTPTVDQIGTYCLAVTNLSTGCVMTDCVNLKDQIRLSLQGPNIFCPGSSLTYHALTTSNTPATLYLLINNQLSQTVNIAAGATNTALVVTLDSTAQISVYAVDATGCHSDTASLLVNENSAHIEFELTQTACNLGQLKATLVGNFQNTALNYNWGSGTGAAILNVTQNGVKTVTIRDNYNCFWTSSYDVVLDFTGQCAYLQGTVRNNLPGNCQASAADVPLVGRIVSASNASGTFFGTTDADGNYWIPVAPGTYTLRILVSPSNGFAACGNDFPATVGTIGASFTQDFLLFQVADCPYMTVDVGLNTLRRCAINSHYLYYCNNGAAVANDASVVLTLDSALILQSAGIPFSSLGNNAYRFELGDVLPGQCGTVNFLCLVPCDVPIGQVHCVQAQVFPDSLCMGYAPNDFMDEDCRPNVGSFDPNVKSASPPGTGSEHFIEAGTEISYQIRFQNTGTDTAFQVILRDTLADKFDFSTLQPGASSHPYTLEFYGQRVLKLTFDGIELPHIGINEDASIGFAQFSIKLRDDLPELDRIENSASIYFDYNEPVRTNTYFHTIRQNPDVVDTYLNEAVCSGETYLFNGEMLSQAGEYSATYTSSTGADSIVHLSLSVFPGAITELAESFCQGGSTVFNGETLTESGDYKITLQTVHSCDSIVNLSLNVWSVYEIAQNAQLCNGSTYSFDGQTLSQPGTYLAIFTSTHGCDSTVTLQLEVVDSFGIQLSQSICEGETYFFNGQSLTQSGAYFAEYQSLAGCDSTVSLNLSVWPNFVETLNLSICEGQFVTIGGQILSEEGTYIDSLKTVHGCDSIIIVNIEEIPTTTDTIVATICQGGIYILDGLPYGNAGTYTATLISQAGCDSLLTLVLSVEPAPVSYDTVSVVQGTNYNGIILLADTTISVVQTDMFGCEFVTITHFLVLPNGTQDLLVQNGFEVFPNPSSGQFNVRFDLLEQRHIQLDVLDVLGRVVHSLSPKTDFAAGEHQMVVQSAAWPSGVYFVRLKVGEANFARKIMVERL